MYHYSKETELLRLFFVKGSLFYPLIVNFCFYLVIVYSLCRSYISNTHTGSYIWRRLYIATLIFILSDVIMLSDIVVNFVVKFFDLGLYYIPYIKNILVCLDHLNILVIDILIVVFKGNRTIWYEFYVKKIKQKKLVNESRDGITNIAMEHII